LAPKHWVATGSKVARGPKKGRPGLPPLFGEGRPWGLGQEKFPKRERTHMGGEDRKKAEGGGEKHPDIKFKTRRGTPPGSMGEIPCGEKKPPGGGHNNRVGERDTTFVCVSGKKKKGGKTPPRREKERGTA